MLPEMYFLYSVSIKGGFEGTESPLLSAQCKLGAYRSIWLPNRTSQCSWLCCCFNVLHNMTGKNTKRGRNESEAYNSWIFYWKCITTFKVTTGFYYPMMTANGYKHKLSGSGHFNV